jgi:hypothetical protein
MQRYLLAALALKAFSANSATKALYRKIGNELGQKLREKAGIDHYLRRGNLLVDLCNRYNIANEGDRLLEIGTGWMHWYSIYLRLHHNVNITMFDVWDNRQFIALRSSFSKLEALVRTDAPRYDDRVIEQLEKILAANSFEELYTLLDLQYVVEKTGRLDQFPDHSFDCVFSFHVLEHISQPDVEVRDIHRILKPGGYSIHQIGIDDHLSHYDRKESPKNYLRYSDRTWKMLFENEVQYINRLQASEWINLFSQEGFSLLEKTTESCDIGSLKISQKYQHYRREDLACTMLTFVHRKPQ